MTWARHDFDARDRQRRERIARRMDRRDWRQQIAARDRRDGLACAGDDDAAADWRAPIKTESEGQ